MSQSDQQPWPGETPGRWRRAWLSRWMKGCSQLTLQTGNRTTLSWQQTAGHRVSLIFKMENASLRKPWIQLYWETYADPPPPLKVVVVGETVDFLWVSAIFCHLYSCYIRARSNLRFHACRVQNKSNKRICAIKHIHGVWTCPLMYVCRWCRNCYIHIFWCCRLLLLLCNSCSPCIFNVLRETGRPHFFDKTSVNLRIHCA